MRKAVLALIITILTTPLVRADEGMWLLPFIGKYNIKQMQQMGFRLSAEDIYSANKQSLKDAIVIFGGGCTGEVVSDQGLVFTNHHCGFGSIQKLSTFEKDYLNQGYWAPTLGDELPAEGLAVTFIRQIEDVSARILPALKGLAGHERDSVESAIISTLVKEQPKQNANISFRIVPMFGGNQYLLFVQERFGDVRFVGAPPQSVGKFGGDTDNWMWPRHTGDFSVFRIYATPDNQSTESYSAQNVPYKPKTHLTVSTRGIKENDPAMTIGFPGSTTRYMTTWEIDNLLEVENPIRIDVRGAKQAIWWEQMCADPKVRLQYANKYAGSSNYWKNSIGKSRGLLRLDIRARKQAQQDAFSVWVAQSPDRVAKYGQALPLIEQAMKQQRLSMRGYMLVREVLSGTEWLTLASQVGQMIEHAKEPERLYAGLKEYADSFFKDYNAATDRLASKKLLSLLADSMAQGELFPYFDKQVRGQVDKFIDAHFDKSPFTDKDRFMALINPAGVKKLSREPIVSQLAMPLVAQGQHSRELLMATNEAYSQGHRLYIAGLMEMEPERAFYPDANFTIRMSYGKVAPYKAADAVHYHYQTTLDGVVAKEDKTNPDFVLSPRLRELWSQKDYGRWAVDGTVPVAFLTTNDITGGNSGSPVLNGQGQLIGLAFDGNWEAMSGDIAFEPDLQRCINVDIRYVLFIIDKMASCNRLIEELTLD
ncbi:MAG: S46 family peptidase [Mucinivorans sp.]